MNATRGVRRYRVRGKVQGVAFRANARRAALSLAIDGWARNCEDGSVEVVAAGSAAALADFARWLARGPIHARVEELVGEDCDEAVPPGFDIR